MRDIRDDLKERIASVSEERLQLAKRLDSLATQEASLKTLLGEENARWDGIVQTPLFTTGETNGHEISPLGQMLLSILGEETFSTERLTAEALARQYPFGEKSPGRVIHFGCMALHNAGLIEKKSDGWNRA